MSTQYSATAPLVGRHKKSNSLIGFDPLLKEDLPAVVSTLTSDRSTPPPESRQQDVTMDLRMIASQLELSSPRQVQEDDQKSPISTPRSRIAAKMPWQKRPGSHRKTRSLASVPNLWNRNQANSSNSTPAHSNTATPTLSPASNHHQHNVSKSSTFSPSQSPAPVVGANDPNESSPSAGMIHDLMELQINSDAFCDLQIPGLQTKPRPTSFLTGQEVVHVSEVDATAWQLEIPAKAEFEVGTKVAEFLESYEKEECLLDLASLVGLNSLELNQFARGDVSVAADTIAACHRPLVESLLECSDDLLVHGFVTAGASGENRQVLILESKRQFLCVFRGTPAEQQGKFSKQPELVQMGGLPVFGDRLSAIQELETATFATLDKLTDLNPFCDIVFAGHSYGAAMATLAAQRYALARSDLRIAVLTTACPMVGAADFRSAVHSLANLKVMRVEYGNGRPMVAPNCCQVGHTIRIHPSVGTNRPVALPVKAYKFGDADDTGRSFFKREKDVSDYVRALESLNTWVKDYHRQDGAGVKGKDNEARQMV
jgi:pimeloyl-ACP methyl ester carboxylesterase